jgi:beta-lactamase regulating signal transducer with metallopeptidase domain
MIAAGHVLFNLLCNSIGSFVLSLALVYALLRLHRFGPGWGELWLLCLPFAKMLFDLAQGIPASSFLWAKLAGQTQDLGWFQVGVGVAFPFGLDLNLQLGAFSGGLIYPQSLADVFDSALNKRVGIWFPGALASTCLALGAGRAVSRVLRSSALLRSIASDARCVEKRQLGARKISVRISERYAGVPFASGVLRPSIVFSARVHAAFSELEREAAIAHELAHIEHQDPLLLALLCVLGDLFWFLPGVHGLRLRIHGLLELRADDVAVRAGTDPVALASALVSAGEIFQTPLVSAAMASERGTLDERVRRLLEARAPSPERRSTIRRVAVLAWITLVTLAVAHAVFFGNHAAALVRYGAS